MKKITESARIVVAETKRTRRETETTLDLKSVGMATWKFLLRHRMR